MSSEHDRMEVTVPVKTSAAWQRGEKAYTQTWTRSNDAVILPSGRPDFDARHVLPASVIDLYTLTVDEHGRDQHGVFWENAAHSPYEYFKNSVRTMAAAVLANPREVEKNLWQALVEAAQHPLIAFIAMQRGQHKNPAMRVAETREYFEGVIRYPFGLRNKRMREVVHMVNARHAAYGVRDREKREIFPHMKRAFKYVTMLYVARLKTVLASGGRVAAKLGHAAEDLYNAADVRLGMREAPVDMEQFLRMEDHLIERGDQLLEQEDPALLAGLQRAAHRLAVNALDAASKRQSVSQETLAGTLSEKTRERLSV